MQRPLPPRLIEAFEDIIDGRIVKRTRHSLFWDGNDHTKEFSDILLQKGYSPALVKDVVLDPGERIPAFLLMDGEAYFGWVFWEKFTDQRRRKLFGSVVRNAKGDWAIQVPEKKSIKVYVNPSLKREMDIDHPSGL